MTSQGLRIQNVETGDQYSILYPFKKILAVTCDFQQCGILTSVDSEEHVQPPFKLRNNK